MTVGLVFNHLYDTCDDNHTNVVEIRALWSSKKVESTRDNLNDNEICIYIDTDLHQDDQGVYFHDTDYRLDDSILSFHITTTILS